MLSARRRAIPNAMDAQPHYEHVAYVPSRVPQARRATYPAGRILHLVPAYLLLGEDALFEEYQGPQGPLRASARPEGALSDDEAASRGLEEAGSLSRGGLEEAGSLSRGGLRPEAAGKVRAAAYAGLLLPGPRVPTVRRMRTTGIAGAPCALHAAGQCAP